MVSLVYETRFKKDYKHHSRRPHNKDLDQRLTDAINLLVGGLPLPARLQDHPLKGGYFGYRELHLKPDLLLIYRRVRLIELRLARLGSHSELF